MSSRLFALLVWALVAASAVFWGLRVLVQPSPAPDRVSPVAETLVARGELSRLLGAAPVVAVAQAPVVAESSRFKLSGVMAPKPPGTRGVALIAIDGKPPRAYRVGARVDAELVLRSVSLRSASLGAGGNGPAFVLDLPLPVPPATGQLPPLNAAGVFTPPAPPGSAFNPQASPSAMPSASPGNSATQTQ